MSTHCQVSMGPLSLRALPDVENIAPSLRNALRFLSYNSCPADDWRLKVPRVGRKSGARPGHSAWCCSLRATREFWMDHWSSLTLQRV